MRILSLKRYRKIRFVKCSYCKKKLETLSNDAKIASFTRPTPDKKFYEVKGDYAHKRCSRKIKAPQGWKKGF